MPSDSNDLNAGRGQAPDLAMTSLPLFDEAAFADRVDIVARARSLLSHPGFAGMIKAMAGDLIAVFETSPRLGKLLGSYRRWFMVQIGFALHARTSGPGHEEGLTASRLASLLEDQGLASRNTVSNFIAEMVAYRLLVPVPGSEGRRSRPLMPTESAVGAMAKWLGSNLAALDRLDGGSRHDMFVERVDLLAPVQMRIVDQLMANRDWMVPGARIMNFLGRDSGGLVLDGLIAGLDLDFAGTGRLPIGRINISQMARRFQLSRINLDRMLKKALENGSIGRRADGGYFMEEAFFHAQLWRQALKFASIDSAWRMTIEDSERPVRPD